MWVGCGACGASFSLEDMDGYAVEFVGTGEIESMATMCPYVWTDTLVIGSRGEKQLCAPYDPPSLKTLGNASLPASSAALLDSQLRCRAAQ